MARSGSSGRHQQAGSPSVPSRPPIISSMPLNTTLSGRGLGAAWCDLTLPWLLVHVLVLGGLGWAAYLYTVRRARREGGLSPR